MSTIHLSTFDVEKIRIYMEGSEVLTRGIAYMKSITPGISEEVAKEAAIRQAQEFCHRKWANDSTGYISSEYVAWTEFEEDVKKGRYFPVTGSGSSMRGRTITYSKKSKWLCFFLCLLLGYVGVHRFYVGKWGTGLIWLCTTGLFGFGWLYDLFQIWSGTFDDATGAYLD